MYEHREYLEEQKARKMICRIGKRMYSRNYVAANDGNISVRTGPDSIICTPTGVSKGFMTPDMLVKVDLAGNQLSGIYKPTSEIKMHLRIYLENPEVLAVTHAHPPAATSFAIAGIPLDKQILPEAVILLGKVPVAPYATPGTQEVSDSVAPFCRKHNAVLLANHGALTWGCDLTEAFHRMEALEHYATILIYSSNIIGRVNELSPDQISKLKNVQNDVKA